MKKKSVSEICFESKSQKHIFNGKYEITIQICVISKLIVYKLVILCFILMCCILPWLRKFRKDAESSDINAESFDLSTDLKVEKPTKKASFTSIEKTVETVKNQCRNLYTNRWNHFDFLAYANRWNRWKPLFVPMFIGEKLPFFLLFRSLCFRKLSASRSVFQL